MKGNTMYIAVILFIKLTFEKGWERNYVWAVTRPGSLWTFLSYTRTKQQIKRKQTN